MDNVIPFKGNGEVGSGVVLDPDTLLENNKGLFSRLVIVGVGDDGCVVVAGSHSMSESYVLLDEAKRALLEL